MYYNLAWLIEKEPERLRVLEVVEAKLGYLSLKLTVHVADYPRREFVFAEIVCANAIDFTIRPPNPATIEGGPLMELHRKHELLKNPGLQMVPGGDGEVFNPPLVLTLLKLDESYVIAQGFQIRALETKRVG